MPLKPFSIIPKTLREWSEWCRNTTVEPGAETVTEAMLADNAASNRVLRDSAPKSVMGNPTASAANPSDIASGGEGRFLGERTGALQFVLLQETDIPAEIARSVEIGVAVAAHEAAANPHPDYVTTAELAAAEAAHEAEANPHTVYPLIAGTPTISGAWTFGNSATRFNFTTGTSSPSAGGAGALPATPAGYVTVNIGGVNRQIPYY